MYEKVRKRGIEGELNYSTEGGRKKKVTPGGSKELPEQKRGRGVQSLELYNTYL